MVFELLRSHRTGDGTPQEASASTENAFPLLDIPPPTHSSPTSQSSRWVKYTRARTDSGLSLLLIPEMEEEDIELGYVSRALYERNYRVLDQLAGTSVWWEISGFEFLNSF